MKTKTKIADISPADVTAMEKGLRLATAHSHRLNHKWWTNLRSGKRIKRNKGELLALIHSEISEALEGERKALMDEKLPHRKAAEVELADALIRIFDYCGGFGYDVAGAFIEKTQYNYTRADHKIENRKKKNGKKF